MNTHRPDIIYRCDFCDECFTEPRDVGVPHSPQYCCPLCGEMDFYQYIRTDNSGIVERTG